MAQGFAKQVLVTDNPPVVFSAGTQSSNLTAVSFNNSNGISFGLSNGVITGTVATNYLTTAQPPGAYLTTAMLSNAGSNFLGTNTALTGNGVSVTANSSGLSINVPAFLTTAQPVGAYLTTAALSNHSHNFATTTTTGASIVVGTTNSNGATIGVPSFLTTAQPVGAYLTTAALSNHSHNLATTTTNGSLIVIATTNSLGATIAVPSFLTTARASNDAIGLNSALTANGVSVTANSSGLSLNFPAFLTTAAQVSHSHGNPTLALTNLTGTTASASNGFTLSLSAAAGGGVTPAVSGSNGSFSFSTLSFGNLNGLSFYTSNGSIVGSYTDAGAGGGITAVNVSAGTTSNNVTNFVFSNSNGVSFGLNGSTITATVAGGIVYDNYHASPNEFMINSQTLAPRQSTSYVFPIIADGYLTFNEILFPISVSFASTSFGGTTANSTISCALYETHRYVLYSRGSLGSSQSLQYISSTEIQQSMSLRVGMNSAGSQYTVTHGATMRDSAGVETNWATNYPVSSGTINISTTHLTARTGLKIRAISFPGSLAPDNYWMAIGVSSTTSTQGIAALTQGRSQHSYICQSHINNAFGFEGSVNNASIQFKSGIGSLSTSGAANTLASINFSNISSLASNIVPYITFIKVNS